MTDIANPKIMVQTELEYGHLRPNSPSIVGDTMLVAYQSKDPGQPGTRMGVYDISNPFQPEEVAYFVPEIPDGARANGINDVYVDENGIMYVVDRLKGGLYVLELTI